MMSFEQYLNLSQTRFEAGDLVNAMEAIGKALQLKPTDSAAYTLYLRIAFKMKDHRLPQVYEELNKWFVDELIETFEKSGR